VKKVPLTDHGCVFVSNYGYERKILASVRYARRFTGERVDYNELISIVEMARWAPSIGNVQPWEILIVDDPMEIKKLSRLHPAGFVYEKASALFFVITDPSQSSHHIIDGGSLMAYLALASSIKGYSVLILGLDDNHVFKTELGVPPTKYLLGLVAIGREAPGVSAIMPRKPVNYIVHHNKYGLRR